MTALGSRLGACGAALAALLLYGGCSSAPDALAPPTRTSDGAVERLRASRDRAFEDIEGARSSRGTAPGPSPSDRSGAESPPGVSSAPPRTGGRPDWAPSGISARYPASDYIVGVGSCRRAQGRDNAAISMAEDRARAEVAKQIRVNIRAEFLGSARLVTEASSGKTVIAQDLTDVTDRITSSASLELAGVQIADRWYDKKAKSYWTIAVLNRATAAEGILDRLKGLMRQVRQDFELGAKHHARGSVFQAVKYYNRAKNRSLGILNYRSQLRVLSPVHADSTRLDEIDRLLTSLWKEAGRAEDELRFGVIVFARVDGKERVAAQTHAPISIKLRELGLNTVKLPRLPEGATFDQLKRASAEALRGWLGTQANCLVLARVASEQIGSEVLVTLRVYFYEAKGEMVVLDLTDARVVASAGFDLSSRTRCANRSPARAGEACLVRAAGILVAQIEKELSEGLGLGK